METGKFLIGGEWRVSQSTRPVVNPYTGKSAGEVYQASAADIEDAIRAAVQAFEKTRQLASFERAEILTKISRAIADRREDFARLMTDETGKPISFSRAEADRAVFTFAVAAAEAAHVEGTVVPLDMAAASRNRTALIQRFPLGPISAITPFNFPLNLVAHKLAPAIAAGCTVVLKPSSSAPRTALELAKIVEDSGLPTGALNVVPCLAGEAEQLITDERIKLLSFTGSPAVGWGIKARAGRKRVVLELGGNAGVIVGSDADLDLAVGKIASGAFGNAGQSCISVQRVYIHSSRFEEFASRFVEAAKSVCVGDPWDEKTVVGPMINHEAAEKVESWIEEARRSGARILCGGKRQGSLLVPTVLADVNPSLKVNCQEVFAPVAVLDRFDTIDEAIAKVNASDFGLQAAIFTNDARAMFKAYRELEVGGVIVNDSSSYRMDHMPYGGVKQSGFGREGVRYALEEMTEMKLLALNVL